MGKGIIIIGTGKTVKDCPFNEETWGVNGSYKLEGKLPNFRHDKLFITDKQHNEESPPAGNFDVETLNKLSYPIVSRNHIEGLNYEPYPFKEIVDRFKTDYFTCSHAYMIAYALYKDYKSIRLYGVDMNEPREFMWQRPCIEAWLFRAIDMGVNVYIHQQSCLLHLHKQVPYGFSISEYEPEEIPREYYYWSRIVERENSKWKKRRLLSWVQEVLSASVISTILKKR